MRGREGVVWRALLWWIMTCDVVSIVSKDVRNLNDESTGFVGRDSPNYIHMDHSALGPTLGVDFNSIRPRWTGTPSVEAQIQAMG